MRFGRPTCHYSPWSLCCCRQNQGQDCCCEEDMVSVQVIRCWTTAGAREAGKVRSVRSDDQTIYKTAPVTQILSHLIWIQPGWMASLLSSVKPLGRWRDGRKFIWQRKCPRLSLSWSVDDDKRFIDARRSSLLLSSVLSPIERLPNQEDSHLPQRSLWLHHESGAGKYYPVCTTPSFFCSGCFRSLECRLPFVF